MNHLATAINTLRLAENSTILEMPFSEEKVLSDLLCFLNMPVKDLARLIDDLPLSDWPLIPPVDPHEYIHELFAA